MGVRRRSGLLCTDPCAGWVSAEKGEEKQYGEKPAGRVQVVRWYAKRKTREEDVKGPLGA